MKIVILGDFHLNPEQYDVTHAAMEDIKQYQPDLIIPLGDFGSQGEIGSVDGLVESERFLRMPGVPLRPILGNHDLERESGKGEQRKGTMQERFVRMFGLDRTYGVLEFNDFRFFFASTEPQSEDSCYDVQEVFATDEQFNWLKSKLRERPGVPVVFFTHAPPVGAGLRTVPRVHVRSTNAYLDENHDPYRWYHLFRNTPEIVMWFSAHYHLSHIHPDSHTVRFGTHFFITGVHGASFTRDGMRQSRILEIDRHSVKVRTLDHIKREVTEEGGWQSEGGIGSLIQHRDAAISRAVSFPVGEAAAIRHGVVPLSADRCLVSTEDGYTWEAEPNTEAVFGTYHIGPALTSIAAKEHDVWLAWGNQVGRSERSSPWRFVRDVRGDWPFEKWELDGQVHGMALHPGGGVWAAAGTNLWRIGESAPQKKSSAERIAALPEPMQSIMSDGRSLWLTAVSGTLYRYAEEVQRFEPYMEHVRAWDSWKGYSAAVVSDREELLLKSQDEHNEYALRLPVRIQEGEAANVQPVCLGLHHILVLVEGQVYFADAGLRTVRKLDIGQCFATSVSRAYHDSRDEACSAFYIAVRSDREHFRPRLELWQKRIWSE